MRLQADSTLAQPVTELGMQLLAQLPDTNSTVAATNQQCQVQPSVLTFAGFSAAPTSLASITPLCIQLLPLLEALQSSCQAAAPAAAPYLGDP